MLAGLTLLILGLPPVLIFFWIWRQWGKWCYRKYEARGQIRRGEAIVALGPPTILVTAYWLFIGIFQLTPMKALMGWFPARVILELTVAGKPIKVSRVFECTQTLCLNDVCFGSLEWRQNRYRIAEKLQTGGWLLADLKHGRCDPAHFDKPVGREEMPILGWADDLRTPTVIERYSVGNGPIPDEGAVDPSIQFRNFNVRYERLSWQHARPDSLKDQDAIRWFDRVAPSNGVPHFEEGEEPRLYSSLVAWVYPNVLSSLNADLASSLLALTEPTKLEAGRAEIRSLNRSLNAIKADARPAGRSREKDPSRSPEIERLPHVISFRYLGDGHWIFDRKNADIEFLYFLGHGTPLASGQSPLPMQTVSIDGHNFPIDDRTYIFVPDGQTLIEIVAQRSLWIDQRKSWLDRLFAARPALPGAASGDGGALRAPQNR